MKRQRWLSLLLAIVMVFGAVGAWPAEARADEETGTAREIMVFNQAFDKYGEDVVDNGGGEGFTNVSSALP